MTIFHIIGFVATCLAVLAALAGVCLFLWAKLIYQRFHWIPFRKGQRRLSLASWHNTRIMQMGNEDPDPAVFTFDDWPIGPRPFYLSYRFGDRRFFVMLGIMGSVRNTIGKGKHPEQAA